MCAFETAQNITYKYDNLIETHDEYYKTSTIFSFSLQLLTYPYLALSHKQSTNQRINTTGTDLKPMAFLHKLKPVSSSPAMYDSIASFAASTSVK